MLACANHLPEVPWKRYPRRVLVIQRVKRPRGRCQSRLLLRHIADCARVFGPGKRSYRHPGGTFKRGNITLGQAMLSPRAYPCFRREQMCFSRHHSVFATTAEPAGLSMQCLGLPNILSAHSVTPFPLPAYPRPGDASGVLVTMMTPRPPIHVQGRIKQGASPHAVPDTPGHLSRSHGRCCETSLSPAWRGLLCVP